MDSETRYADSEGVSIAYQVHGEGDLDLVFVSGFVSHAELFWDEPIPSRLFRRLAAFSRLIMFDKRGQGLSDRLGTPPTLDESMRDLRAVMDAVGSERAALLGISEGGPMCQLFAATHPERTRALVLYGTYARLARAPDYPQGVPDRAFESWAELLRREWGGPVGIELWAPTAAGDPSFRDWWARLLRQGTSPGGARDLMDLYRHLDARTVLPTIRVPTLVLHRSDDRVLGPAHGRYLAENIEGARYVELPGEDHLPMAGDTDAIVDEVEEFLVGTRHTTGSERALATVLFTDIVGSTERAASLGDRRWGDLVAAHDAAVRRALRLFQGNEIKTMGDGFLATFDRPAQAIRAAREIRDATRALGVEIRAGIHTGEVALVRGDVAGMAVNIGARVGALAGAGEVLVSSTVKELVVGSGIDFLDRGAHALKGVPGDWRLFAVADQAPEAAGPDSTRRDEAAGSSEAVQPPLPPALVAAAEGPLVGREAELGALRAAWEASREGRPRPVLVAGEPGIGKTRSAAEIAREAASEGALVLYGRCDEVPIVPYQPFVEALDRVVAGGALEVQSLAPVHRAELERVLPGLAADATPASSAAASDPDPEGARYRLFDAVRAALVSAMAGGPMLLVLDDLHWADRPTSSLLLHLVRWASAEPFMVVGTYRDIAVGPDGPLAPVLAELRRQGDLTELALTPLGASEVEDLVARAEIDGVDPALGRRLHSRTGGNPLFVVESLRDLAERALRGELEGGEVPIVIRDVIDGRLARAGAESLVALRAAAVAGEQFELVDIEAVADMDPSQVLSAVEAVADARLVRELPGAPGRYAFSHALVRDALYESLSSARRARLHLSLGEAQGRRGAPPAAVAGHLLAAAPLGDPDASAGWIERAAQDASAAAAHEEAAALLRRALDRLGPLSPSRRAALLLELGGALDRSGRRDEAREAFWASAGLARETGDPELLARAALGYKGLGVTIVAVDRDTVALLEEALEASQAIPAAVRARVLAALALEVYYEDEEQTQAMSSEAVELARTSGDSVALAETLSARHAALWTPQGAVERLAVATEMSEAAGGSGDRIAGLQARNWRVLDLLELARIDEAENEVDVYAAEAEALRLPRFGWYVPLWRSALAILRGRFELAERERQAAAELGREAQDANAVRYPLIQRNLLLLEQRRFEEFDVEAILEQTRGSTVQRGAWLAFHTLMHAELGQVEEAYAAFEEITADSCAALPRGANWHAMCELAEASALLGETRVVPDLLELLSPHASLNPVVGRGIGCCGPVAYFLGRLEATAGRSAEAARRFEQALHASEGMGARPRAALSRLRLGEALTAGGDEARGSPEIERARREMESLGVRPPLGGVGSASSPQPAFGQPS